MIEFHDVSYRYGAGGPDAAAGPELFSGVRFTLAPGDFLFLTGPSGAGKSTLLKLCYMELRPTAGRVTAFGSDVGTMSRDEVARTRRRIGIVHQDCRFLDHLSLAENVALPLVVAGRAVDRGDLADLLGWVGLSGRAEARPPELSGGERQRAALARAVMLGPDVILADEPTGNIDWEMSERLLELLVELGRLGKAVLLATHDLALIRAAKARIAARVLRIAGQRLHFAGAEL